MSKPDFVAMTAREYKDGDATKTHWTEIGAAWRTKSGEGINITLNAFPVDGSFTLFPPRDPVKAEPQA